MYFKPQSVYAHYRKDSLPQIFNDVLKNECFNMLIYFHSFFFSVCHDVFYLYHSHYVRVIDSMNDFFFNQIH